MFHQKSSEGQQSEMEVRLGGTCLLRAFTEGTVTDLMVTALSPMIGITIVIVLALVNL